MFASGAPAGAMGVRRVRTGQRQHVHEISVSVKGEVQYPRLVRGLAQPAQLHLDHRAEAVTNRVSQLAQSCGNQFGEQRVALQLHFLKLRQDHQCHFPSKAARGFAGHLLNGSS